jgi:hypothetical protein
MAVRSPPSVKEMRPMDATMIDEHLENLDRRLARVEQFLPTLATKEELRTLATKEELRATEDNLRLALTDAVDELRRHTHVLTESLRGDIHMLAAHAASERPKDSGPSAMDARQHGTPED